MHARSLNLVTYVYSAYMMKYNIIIMIIITLLVCESKNITHLQNYYALLSELTCTCIHRWLCNWEWEQWIYTVLVWIPRTRSAVYIFDICGAHLYSFSEVIGHKLSKGCSTATGWGERICCNYSYTQLQLSLLLLYRPLICRSSWDKCHKMLPQTKLLLAGLKE